MPVHIRLISLGLMNGLRSSDEAAGQHQSCTWLTPSNRHTSSRGEWACRYSGNRPTVGPCDLESRLSSGSHLKKLTDSLGKEFQIVRTLLGKEAFAALAVQFVGAVDRISGGDRGTREIASQRRSITDNSTSLCFAEFVGTVRSCQQKP